MKTIKQVQKDVDNWVSQFKEPYFPPLSQMASITEEAGEIARILNRTYGSKKAKPEDVLVSLEEELGDLLFTTICLANSQGIDLEVAFTHTLEKLNKRDSNRFEKKAK